MTTSEQRFDTRQQQVRKQYSQFYFITINCVEFHSAHISILISFLKIDRIREKLLPVHRIRAIQEELAGFMTREVVDEKGEHYVEDEELYM